VFACVNHFEFERHIFESVFDLFRFVFAHKAVIDVHAEKLIGDSLAYERGNDRTVHAARKTEKHAFVSDLFANCFDLSLDIIVERVVSFCAANVDDEVFKHVFAVRGAFDFRVELHTEDGFRSVFKSGARAVVRRCGHFESVGDFGNVVGVAHEHVFVLFYSVENHAVADMHERLTVFAHAAFFDDSAESVRNVLHAVADAENGHAEVENVVGATGRIFKIHAVRTARENDADRIDFFQARLGNICGFDDGIYVHTSDGAGDEFFILSAEIQHENGLIFHKRSFICRF